MKAKLLRSLSGISRKSEEGKELAEKFSRQLSSGHSSRHKKGDSNVCLLSRCIILRVKYNLFGAGFVSVSRDS